ncbi:trans-2,3-dihydro-3-hydroxyanthranilate isomerase [Microdochium nivale]|nr:trans-2,3-dihydro-3-hydroxyanthranilate isomerase [Microdochium nivale]
MSLSFVTLDVFTTDPFRGNPLAVCHVPAAAAASLSQQQKLLIAREFNLAETVFLHEQSPSDIDAGEARIDIFTPFAELPFAGHPTIGTANYMQHYLSKVAGSGGGGINCARALRAKAGLLPFGPVSIPGPASASPASGIQLGVAHKVHIHDRPFRDRPFGDLPVVSIVRGMTFILARKPDLEALAEPTEALLGSSKVYGSAHFLDEGWQVGHIPTYFYVDMGYEGGDGDGDDDRSGTRLLRTRTWSVREDPATGSAACALCAYLSLTEKGGRAVRKFHLTQGVEMGRESHIYVEVRLGEDDNCISEVLLSGSAVKVIEGTIPIPQL